MENEVITKRQLTFAQAIKEATEQCMQEDPSVFIIGEGVPDPKGIFGTTTGLREKFGPKRVLDMPLSENALTGMCIGAAVSGMKPILTHQRVDFSLLALDQVFSNAAKWHYMFGGQQSVPLVIRMVIGRGWGQGAQHSQNLQALYAHIPGLKVVMPTTAYDAKGMLISAIRDKNPVIFIEHRWLHNIKDYVPEESYTVPLGKAKVIKQGTDITLASTSYMTIEALKAAEFLETQGVSAEVVDIRTLREFDERTVAESVAKTGNLIALDSGYYSGGFAGEVLSRISERHFSSLKSAPQRITLPDIPTPSTPGLTKYYYPRAKDIVEKVAKMLKVDGIHFIERGDLPLDIPDKTFTGPF